MDDSPKQAEHHPLTSLMSLSRLVQAPLQGLNTSTLLRASPTPIPPTAYSRPLNQSELSIQVT